MKLEDVEAHLDLACNSGGSGQGMSHWAVASRCGMRAHLDWLRSEEDALQGITRSLPGDKVNARRVGSAYHKLQEWWREGKLDNVQGIFAHKFEDPSFDTAVKLFELYSSTFPRRLWGQHLRMEWQLPDDNRSIDVFDREFNGNATVNAKPDLVTRVQEADLEEIRRRVNIPGPGIYIIDFKTAGMVHDHRYYTESLQAYWYPHAVALAHPELGEVQGIIFDVIHKPRRKADPVTFEAIFSPYRGQEFSRKILRPLIRQGKANILSAQYANYGNSSECIKVGFGGDDICPYFQQQCTHTRIDS